MYHEAMYHVVQHILKIYGSVGQILPRHVFLCNRNVCSPAWANNVIGQHESFFRLVASDFVIREVLSSSVFFP
jgi:hypothetical protein